MWENIFRVEGLIYRIGSKAWGLLVLNLLMIVTSLPLFTIGASLTSAFYVTVKMIKNDDYRVVKNYFTCFKQNFKKSTLLWLIILIPGLVLGVDWLYLAQTKQFNSWLMVGVVIGTVIVIQFFQVAFFYISRYELPMKEMLKNMVQLMLQQPFKCMLVTVVFLFPYVLILFSPYLFVFQLYISLFVGLSFNLFLRTYVLLMIFQRYEA